MSTARITDTARIDALKAVSVKGEAFLASSLMNAAEAWSELREATSVAFAAFKSDYAPDTFVEDRDPWTTDVLVDVDWKDALNSFMWSAFNVIQAGTGDQIDWLVNYVQELVNANYDMRSWCEDSEFNLGENLCGNPNS